MFGPIFNREATVVPKRPKTYLIRGLYVLTLFLLLCTGYLVLDGSRSLATSGDSARFGGWMFTLLAPLQLLVLASFGSVLPAAKARFLEMLLPIIDTSLCTMPCRPTS